MELFSPRVSPMDLPRGLSESLRVVNPFLSRLQTVSSLRQQLYSGDPSFKPMTSHIPGVLTAVDRPSSDGSSPTTPSVVPLWQGLSIPQTSDAPSAESGRTLCSALPSQQPSPDTTLSLRPVVIDADASKDSTHGQSQLDGNKPRTRGRHRRPSRWETFRGKTAERVHRGSHRLLAMWIAPHRGQHRPAL